MGVVSRRKKKRIAVNILLDQALYLGWVGVCVCVHTHTCTHICILS